MLETIQDEITPEEALREAPITAAAIEHLAEQFRQSMLDSLVTGNISAEKIWYPPAKTYICHTMAVAQCASLSILHQVVDTFFNASVLPHQPWYDKFRRGYALPSEDPNHQLTEADFNVGLLVSRYYRQLCSRHELSSNSVCITLRSVRSSRFTTASTGRLAITLPLTGDLFHYEDGLLCWHHVCTTAGVNMPIPQEAERRLLNFLRFSGLDTAEQATFQQEALGWIRFVEDQKGFQHFYNSYVKPLCV